MIYKTFAKTVNSWQTCDLGKTDIIPLLQVKKIKAQLIVGWYAQGQIARHWQILGPESRVKKYSPVTAARGRSVEIVIIPDTVERILLLNLTLQTICNFILQSGSLITFSNHSSLQSVLIIELINIAIKIVEQFRLKLQYDHN